MANKLKETVDYFPFFVKDGRTFYVLKRKYGVAGIGMFSELCRALAREPGQVYSMRHAYDRDRLVEFIGSKEFPITEEELFDFLDTLAETGKIDSDLWLNKRIIASADYLENLTEVYRRRTVDAPRIETVREQFLTLEDFIYDCRQYDGNMTAICDQYVGMVTHKVKESKVKERKEEAAVEPPYEDDIPFENENHSHTLTHSWYREHQRKTGKLIEPSEKDYKEATDLLKRTDLETATAQIPVYFECEEWFVKAKGSGRRVWSFQGFCRNFTELVSLTPQGPPGDKPGTCPACGRVILGKTKCPICGEELVYEKS